jgi:hypothetical protein
MKDGFFRLLYSGSLLAFHLLVALLGLLLFLTCLIVYLSCLPLLFLCRYLMILVLTLSKSEVLEQRPHRIGKS